MQQPLASPINEKRVAEEYATTSMSIVMATMARSMPQFGLLMILVVLPMQNAIWWCHATGEHAEFVQDVMLRAPTTHFGSESQAILFRGGH